MERCKVFIGTGSADVSYMLDKGLMTALSRKEAVIVCVVDGVNRPSRPARCIPFDADEGEQQELHSHASCSLALSVLNR